MAPFHAHHIIPRSRLINHGNMAGYFDLDNGVTLCLSCHFYRLKDYVDSYIIWRDEWLLKRGIKYSDLEKKYYTPCKLSTDQIKLIGIGLKNNLKTS